MSITIAINFHYSFLCCRFCAWCCLCLLSLCFCHNYFKIQGSRFKVQACALFLVPLFFISSVLSFYPLLSYVFLFLYGYSFLFFVREPVNLYDDAYLCNKRYPINA